MVTAVAGKPPQAKCESKNAQLKQKMAHAEWSDGPTTG